MTSVQALVDRQMLMRRLFEERRPPAESSAAVPPHLRVITVSRQTGSGGRALASRLSQALGFELVDRQILDFLVTTTGARERLLASLDERTRSNIQVWLEGMMMGRYLGNAEYTHWLIRSIHALAARDPSVILGRGANFVLGPELGLHVRVIAPRELRVRNLMQYLGLSAAEAEHRVAARDEERRRFSAEHFHADIEEPSNYHLVVNTGRVSLDEARELVLGMWKGRMA